LEFVKLVNKINKINKINKNILHEQSDIFCDSVEALNWAYKNGLSKKSIVRTSSPAVLRRFSTNIVHLESRWSVLEMRKFQTSIEGFSIEVYNSLIKTGKVPHEYALCVALFSVHFQRVLYKASCLKDEDFTSKKFFLRVEGEGGPAGNNMNSPWCEILKENSNFSSYCYSLKEGSHKTLSTEGVSKFDRFKYAGIETLFYRSMLRVTKYIPDSFFKKKALVYGESELIIETMSALMRKRVKVKKINIIKDENKKIDSQYTSLIISTILPIVRERSNFWLSDLCKKPFEELFVKNLTDNLGKFERFIYEWRNVLIDKDNTFVVANCPGNFKGQSLALVCREKRIPLISAQHGVTIEISQLHGEISAAFDSAISNYTLFYNKKSAKIEGESYFSKATPFVVGMSMRHIRMKKYLKKTEIPIVYISTNLYKGNIGLFSVWNTDYDRSLSESLMITKVLSKLPHKVRYKPYPEDNKRYSDSDPVFKDVLNSDNVELYKNKIDMRYLVSEHRIAITASATSTLSWPIMSEKPVIFINQKNKGPLTEKARLDLGRAIFVFDDDEINFHNNLVNFLSQEIEEIEKKWKEKSDYRRKVIKEYFSEYEYGAGERAANKIMNINIS
jgi:hypothetical protein